MKRFLLLTACCLGLASYNADAFITVTAASGGTNICSNLAVGGSNPAFTTLGNIVVTEGANTDISNGAHTLVLSAPAGWQFNTASPPTVTFTPGRNITAASIAGMTTTTLSVNVTAAGTTQLDVFNIIGLQVQATSTAAAAGSILPTSVAGMFGIFPPAFPNFGNLSLSPSPNAVTVTGGGTFCDNATLNASLVGAGTIYYQGAQYNGTLTATPSTSEVITNPGTNTFYFRARSAAGCWGAQGSATVTINQTVTGMAIDPASPAVCLGDSVQMIASALAGDVDILHEDFNAGLGAWTITTLSGNATAAFQIRNSPGYSNIVAGDGSPYVQAAPDAENTVTTHTILTSPSFSTVGYTAATVAFNEYYQTWTTDTIVDVEYSTDGTSWTPFLDQLGVTSGATTWLSTTPSTAMALPSGALGQPNVWLRWNYRSFWGWYWAIDNISVRGTPELSYVWTGGSGLSCTTCDTVMYTPSVAATEVFTVTFNTVGGCDATTTVSVTTNPLPAIYNVTGGGAYCAGGTGVNIGLDNSDLGVDYGLYQGATSVGSLAGIGGVLDFGPQTTAGTYTVLATDPVTLCTSAMNDSAVITIDTLPTAITGPNQVCEGDTITLATASTGGTWSSSDITIANALGTGDVAGIAGGVADISYTLPTTCYVTYSVTVNALPIVAPITGVTSLCVGNTTTLSDVTPGGTWSSAGAGIASIDASGMVTAVAPGVTTMSYTVTDGFGCVAYATTPDTVSAVPAAAIMPAGPYVTMCQGSPVNLIATVVPGATYEWSTGGAPIPGATDHNYIATATGTYTLNMTLGACAWSLPVKTVLPDPTAVVSYNATGDYLYTGTFSSYQWFRNGTAIAGATNGIYFSPTGGDYTVVVADITGCADTSAIFTVAPTGFSAPGPASAIKIYPNPASSVLHIDAPMAVKVTVMAPDGRIVLRGEPGNAINVSGLASGAYIIQVFDEQNTLLQTARFSKTD